MKFLLHLILASLLLCTLQARTLTDGEGRHVTLPDHVEKVFGSSPPMSYLIYTLNPDKMVGLNFNAKNGNNGADKAYLDERFLSLPVIGSFHGGGQKINLESLMARKPQLVLVWQDDMMVRTIRQEIAKTSLPTFMVPFRHVGDMPRAFRLAADAIGETERGEKLARYSEKIIAEVARTAKTSKKTRYYYAEGLDGLSTECDRSFHVEALNFAGGENVHKCRQSNLLGLEKVSFETILAYDPDVVIVQNPAVYSDLANDPMWKNLRAVKNGRIHLVPMQPFNWIDRPPSFMRVLGIQWAAAMLHPQTYTVDLTQRTREFFDLFLRVRLNDNQIQTLLGAKP